jgi:hypothetical protein
MHFSQYYDKSPRPTRPSSECPGLLDENKELGHEGLVRNKYISEPKSKLREPSPSHPKEADFETRCRIAE